jgi:hypothetical protein
LLYEFNGENDCNDTGLSDDSDSDVNTDGNFIIVGGVTGECDTKGNGDEGFGDEVNVKCDDEVDGNKCVVVDDDDDDDDDEGGGGGVNDDGNGEDDADDEIDDDERCDAVAEECDDGRLL